MYYHFRCQYNHLQELKLSFAEFAELQKNKNGHRYIECNVKYGELGNPKCTQPAYQEFGQGEVGFSMNYQNGNKH
jgi:hypothetical protein